MADLAALVEAEAGALAARRAAVHGARLHHQVVVGPEKGIGHQRLQPAADRLAFHVAGDHPQSARRGRFGRVQPLHQRAVRHHRRQARHGRRIGALARDVAEKLGQGLDHRQLRQLHRPAQHRDVGVEAFAGEQGAARRAGHAHDALDHDVVPVEQLDQLGEGVALCFERGSHRLAAVGAERLQVDQRQGVGLEQGLVGVFEPLDARRAHQHLGHQAAAGVGEQAQPGIWRAGLRQGQRVVDRTLADGGVVERVDLFLVVVEQRADPTRVVGPQLAEGAGGTGKGAVDQHQRPVVLCGGLDRPLHGRTGEGFQLAPIEPIHALADLTVDLVDERLPGQLGRLGPEDLEDLEHHLAEKSATRAACRRGGLLEPAPAQLRRYAQLAGRGIAVAPALLPGLGQQQRAGVFRMQDQLRAALDLQHHHVLADDRLEPVPGAAVAPLPHPNRVDDLPVEARHGELAANAGAARRAGFVTLTGDDEDDRLLGLSGHARCSWSMADGSTLRTRAPQGAPIRQCAIADNNGQCPGAGIRRSAAGHSHDAGMASLRCRHVDALVTTIAGCRRHAKPCGHCAAPPKGSALRLLGLWPSAAACRERACGRPCGVGPGP